MRAAQQDSDSNGSSEAYVDRACAQRRALLGGLLATPLIVCAGCATNPATGRNQLILVSDTSLVQMSATAWAEERRRNRVWDNPDQHQRLARVGARLVRVAPVPAAQWEFVLWDRPERNAYVLPGGKVGFYRGLAEFCERDDHVATVLGHEIGHVVGRHPAERTSREIAKQSVLSVAGAAIDSSIARSVLGIGAEVGFALPFSRAQESEADRIGVDLMHAAGYDVNQAPAFWRRMAADSSGRRTPEFLATHPSPHERAGELAAYIHVRGWR